jgi:hypothetical protein
MVRNSASNTRRVPVDHNMFASRSGGLTIVGPDERIWQSDLKSDNLVPVDRAVALATGMVPALDPQDYVDQIRMGSNRTLYQSVLNSSGVAKWEAITDLHPDMSNGFKLPKKVENDAILEESTLDDDGIILSQFVGSYASYWRMDAIRAFWNGVELYTYEGRYLHCPDAFKRGFPATMGLEGLIYIPRESYLEDLLLTQDQRDSGHPAIYHPNSEYNKLEVNTADDRNARAVHDAFLANGIASQLELRGVGADAPGGGRAATAADDALALPKLLGHHRVTGRKVGDQDAEGCFKSAWDAAIFEVVDLYTEPEKTFEQRRLVLDTTVKPLQDAYKHLRLLPVNPILSKSWAQNAYDQLPSNAALVFSDPSNKYDGATTARDPNRPRKTFEKKDKGAPLVGWKLDGAGNLDTLIVEGTDQEKSAINVGEGELWVNAPDTTTLTQYNNRMNMVKAQFKSCAVDADAANTYDATQVNKGDAMDAIKAYEADAEEQHKDQVKAIGAVIDTKRNAQIAKFRAENARLNAAMPSRATRGEIAAREKLMQYLSGARNGVAPNPSGPVVGHRPGADVAINLMAWTAETRRAYQRSFPVSSLISYKLKKGDRASGIEDSYVLTRVTIV